MTKQNGRVKEIIDEPQVSTGLRRALRLAQRANLSDLDRWCRLELGGYWRSNQAMGEDITVPEYRTVVGQHVDIYGRVLLLQPGLEFVNETRLRNGVEELEFLAENHNVVSMQDPTMLQLIRENFHVEVNHYRFSAVHVVGILSEIRTQLAERLRGLQALPAAEEPRTEEVLMLRPNYHGIGIDIPALLRRWKRAK